MYWKTLPTTFPSKRTCDIIIKKYMAVIISIKNCDNKITDLHKKTAQDDMGQATAPTSIADSGCKHPCSSIFQMMASNRIKNLFFSGPGGNTQ